MAQASIAPNVLTQVSHIARAVCDEVGKAFIGPDTTTRILLTSLLARGHVLIEGVPGVAKTTLVKTFAKVLGCEHGRIQFTPDLLPSDITGTNVLDMKTNEFVLRRGPIFSNILLGDEINRAPAKTQSALLEAMQEKQVTIDGETHTLTKPFFVLATQNPVEHEGTYPLPDAQVDRFLIKLVMGYPTPGDEKRMLVTYGDSTPELKPVLSVEEILHLQELCSQIHCAEEIFDYVLALAQFTRGHPAVYLGASPRAALALLHAAKAIALIQGRDYVLPDDIQFLAPLTLAHRLVLTPESQLDGKSGTHIIGEALERTPYRQPRDLRPA